MTKFRALISGTLTALMTCGLLSACSKQNSQAVETQEMYFTMALIEQSATTIKCYVRISEYDKWGNSIELDGNDELFCNGQKMGKQESIGEYVYYTTRIQYRPQQPITIAFKRGKNVYNSVNYAPDQIELTSPANSFNLNFDDELDVTWTQSQKPGEKIYINLAAKIPDSGNFEIVNSTISQSPESGQVRLKSIKSQTKLGLNQNAELTLTLSRTIKGTVSSELNGHFDSTWQQKEIKGTLYPQ